MGRWIEIVRSGGDGTLGEALVRLAREAEAVHRYEVMRRVGYGMERRVEGLSVEEALAVVEGWGGNEEREMGEVEGVTAAEVEALLGGGKGGGE